jgi:predicted PurR-regulated permease PerM
MGERAEPVAATPHEKAAWLLVAAALLLVFWRLVALLVFETTFGVTGLILAPIIYAYAKKELIDRGLI